MEPLINKIKSLDILNSINDGLYITDFPFQPGDRILAFTDGAIEIRNKADEELGEEGLLNVLKNIDYLNENFSLSQLEESLLTYSNNIRLDDDLTMLELTFLT